MNTVLDFDGPAALEFRARHYEAQLKAQAARIIELEAKVAYLEKCLREANAKMAGAALVLNAEPSSSTIRASASLHQAAEESCDMIGPSSSTGVSQPISKPATSIPSTGSAEAPIIPLVVEDSDNDDVPPPQPAESSRPRSPLIPPKRRVLDTESAPSSESHAMTTVYTPRKKPKLIVEVVIPSRPKPRPSSRALQHPRTPSDLEVSDRGPLEVHDADTRPITLSSPSEPISTLSPSPVSFVCDHLPEPSRKVEDHPTAEHVQVPVIQTGARAESRELSYLDDLPEAPSPVADQGGPQVHIANHAMTTIQAQVSSSTPQVSVHSMSALELQTEIVPESAPHDPPRIQDRLVGIPRFIIPVPNSPVERFLVTKKGKNNFPSLTVPLRELLASRNYILPKLAFNPYLPPEPGCPGLLYQAHDRSKWEPGDQTVFIWLDYGLLRYVGEYSLELDGPMSKEEYQSWSPELKKAWAISILTMSAFRDIRTRILLGQQLGRRPNGKEVMAAVRSRRFDNLEGVAKSNARAAIINAYEGGNERMIIWRMKCVGFDEELLQQMTDMKNGAHGGTQGTSA